MRKRRKLPSSVFFFDLLLLFRSSFISAFLQRSREQKKQKPKLRNVHYKQILKKKKKYRVKREKIQREKTMFELAKTVTSEKKERPFFCSCFLLLFWITCFVFLFFLSVTRVRVSWPTSLVSSQYSPTHTKKKRQSTMKRGKKEKKKAT